MEQDQATIKACSGKHLKAEHRRIIEVMRNRKFSTSEIAEEIGVSQRTIQRELKRGEVDRHDSELRKYRAYSSDRGQGIYEDKCKNKGYKSLVDKYPEINKYIAESIIEKHWSPDIIAHRMAQDIGISVCTKTIYNNIDKGKIRGVNNGMLLEKPFRRKRKKSLVLRRDRRCPERKSIEERPVEVESRQIFGHWEIDLVVGKKKGSGAALLTLVERQTRFPIIIKLKDQTQKSVIDALGRLERKKGSVAFRKQFKSITADNGSEFLDVKHLEKSVLTKYKRTTFYYAHPYASWERGSNENMNKMIRRFIRKGDDIGKYTKKQIKEIEEFLRNYPRKILDYKTPEEYYSSEVV